jgi:amino acid adenylation domain-containing protein
MNQVGYVTVQLLPFCADALEALAPRDQVTFQHFGQGPHQAVPCAAIHHAFEARARELPDAIAIEHLGDAITYRELDDASSHLACTLVAHGVRPGDAVALFVQRSIPMVVGMLAALKAGAAYVPQDAGITPRSQLEHVIATARPRVILTLASLRDAVPVPAGVPCLAIDEVSRRCARAPRPDVVVSRDATCFILFTSGTTGMPNGVQVTHKNVCNILLTAPGDLGIRPGMKVSQILNIAFDMAAWEIWGCLANGGTLVIRGKVIADTVRRVDVVIATPSILGTVDPAVCHGVKVAAVAGEPCSIALADTWARFCTFYNSCGPTETTIVNTMHLHRAGGPLTIGAPTPNNTVYVLDEHRRPCSIGQVGELWAGGDCVSAGYLDNPELNAERYVADPFLGGDRMMFRTRDLGRWTAGGELEHLGRTDDQVKIRGFRVELDSVTSVLETVAGCAQAVTLKLDAQTLVAFVRPAAIDPAVAIDRVARTLPYYCVPALVIAVDELPMTSRGKLDKQKLLAIAAAERNRPSVVAAEPAAAPHRPSAHDDGRRSGSHAALAGIGGSL